MNHHKKITYSEIAEVSGISIATISRVINNTTSVREETRNAVIEAMQGLGYDTSILEALSQKSNDLIIFNIPSLDNPFYSLSINGAIAAALRNGYYMLVNEDPSMTNPSMHHRPIEKDQCSRSHHHQLHNTGKPAQAQCLPPPGTVL